MKRTAIVLCVFLAACSLLSGCESMGRTWNDTWTTSKEYYKEYINPDPEVDLNRVDYSSSEEKLAALFAPVDRPMGALARYLNRKDSFPGDKWQEELFVQFPWINGLVVSTLDGQIVSRRPEAALKPLNLQPFLDMGADIGDRRLHSYTDVTPFGPELYLGTAMYRENELVGFIAVHFDPRSLVKRSAAPEQLVILTPGVVLWPGSEPVSADSLLTESWESTLTEDVSGTLERDGREFVWLARYLGDKQLVYLTEAAPEREGEDDDSFLWFF